MKNPTKIAIVGAGKMGSAMLQALKPDFPKTFAYDKGSNLPKVLKEADIIIFAVKPQDFSEIHLDLNEKSVISIMAGISISRVKKQTGATQIVRSMPNLPLQISEGLTGWIATKEVRNKQLIKQIFKCFGEEIEVKAESDLDKITPLSGSGPAYFFYLCKLIQENAEKLGFTKKQAQKIAKQTFVGSAKIFEQSNQSAQEWITAVASKKGTTQQVLNYLEKNRFPSMMQKAIKEGVKRSKELNQ